MLYISFPKSSTYVSLTLQNLLTITAQQEWESIYQTTQQGLIALNPVRDFFTTRNFEERIQLAKEDRKAKLELRYLKREGDAAGIGLCQESGKIESEVDDSA